MRHCPKTLSDVRRKILACLRMEPWSAWYDRDLEAASASKSVARDISDLRPYVAPLRIVCIPGRRRDKTYYRLEKDTETAGQKTP